MSDAATGGRIVALRWATYRAAIELPIRVSFGGTSRRQAMTIEVETSDGAKGVGETWVNYPAWAPIERCGALREGLGPLVLGMDCDDVEEIVARARSGLIRYGRQAGAMGPIHSLLCGLEMALFDLTSVRQGLSLGSFLGASRTSARLYSSGLDSSSDPNRIDGLLAAGYRMFKFKVGFDFESDLAALARFRARLGPDIPMMIDANQAFDGPTALRFAQAAAPLGVRWFEEPVDCRDFEAMRMLRARSPVPIAAGENWYGLDEICQAIRIGCVDIIQPDLAKNLGIRDARRLADICAENEVELAFHNFSSIMSVVASAHVASSLPGDPLVEIDTTGSPIVEHFTSVPLQIVDGTMRLPLTPGLGVPVTMTPDSIEEMTA